MITCTRRIQFCAGHRVMGHENKCAHLHGHNYVVEITAVVADASGLDGERLGLDEVGRVVDFSVLKERVGGWIEHHWDHGFLLNDDDVAGKMAVCSFETDRGEPQRSFLMSCNPTAENMANYLLLVVCPSVLSDTRVRATRVVVHETENCKAEAAL